jgi:hypothetical protein
MELSANLPTLALLPDASELTTRWQKTPMQVQTVNDTAVLLKVATRLCGVGVTTVDEALVSASNASADSIPTDDDCHARTTHKSWRAAMKDIRWRTAPTYDDPEDRGGSDDQW